MPLWRYETSLAHHAGWAAAFLAVEAGSRLPKNHPLVEGKPESFAAVLPDGVHREGALPAKTTVRAIRRSSKRAHDLRRTAGLSRRPDGETAPGPLRPVATRGMSRNDPGPAEGYSSSFAGAAALPPGSACASWPSACW